MSGKKDRLEKRLERKIARKKKRLEKITPTAPAKPVKSSGTESIFNTPDPSAKKARCVKGSCEAGNLRAEKSTPSKGLKKERTKANVAGKGLPQKRKKLQSQIAELEREKKALGKKPLYTNPRLL